MHQPGSAFTSCPIDHLHDSLARYLHSRVAQSARYDETEQCYKYQHPNGTVITCGGLHRALKSIFYAHYTPSRSRRNSSVQIKGSTKAQGIKVDKQVSSIVEGRYPIKMHDMTQRLLDYWRDAGETLQAAQVPVPMTLAQRKMTQADVITRDSKGRLILYELKTGAPVGFSTAQGTLSEDHVANVKCTKETIWQLQLAYTKMALIAAGVDIFAARVIQIFEKKHQGLFVKIYPEAKWTSQLPLQPKKSQQNTAPVKAKKKGTSRKAAWKGGARRLPPSIPKRVYRQPSMWEK
jgi:hypothetical protein